jgi:hypothetical protein
LTTKHRDPGIRAHRRVDNCPLTVFQLSPPQASANAYGVALDAHKARLRGFSGGEQQAITNAANLLPEDFLRSLAHLPRAATPSERAGACIELVNLAEGCQWRQRSPLRAELLQGLASMLMYERTAAVRQLIYAAIHAIRVNRRSIEPVDITPFVEFETNS